MDTQVRLLDFQCTVDAAMGGQIAAAVVHLVGWDVAFWSGCSRFAVHCFERPGELQPRLHHPVSEQELKLELCRTRVWLCGNIMDPADSSSPSTSPQCHYFADLNLKSSSPRPSICLSWDSRGFLVLLLTNWNGQVVWTTILRCFGVAFGRFL